MKQGHHTADQKLTETIKTQDTVRSRLSRSSQSSQDLNISGTLFSNPSPTRILHPDLDWETQQLRLITACVGTSAIACQLRHPYPRNPIEDLKPLFLRASRSSQVSKRPTVSHNPLASRLDPRSHLVVAPHAPYLSEFSGSHFLRSPSYCITVPLLKVSLICSRKIECHSLKVTLLIFPSIFSINSMF